MSGVGCRALKVRGYRYLKLLGSFFSTVVGFELQVRVAVVSSPDHSQRVDFVFTNLQHNQAGFPP